MWSGSRRELYGLFREAPGLVMAPESRASFEPIGL